MKKKISPLFGALASQAPLIVVETEEREEMSPHLLTEFRRLLRQRRLDPNSAQLKAWSPLGGLQKPAVFERDGAQVQGGQGPLDALLSEDEALDAMGFLRSVAQNLSQGDKGQPTLWVWLNPKPFMQHQLLPQALARLAEYIQKHYSGLSRLVLLGVVGDLPPFLRPYAHPVPPSRPSAEDLQEMLQAAIRSATIDLPRGIRQQIPLDELNTDIPALARVLQGLGWRQAVDAIKQAMLHLASPGQVMDVMVQAKIGAVKTIAPFASVSMPPEEPPPLVGLERAKAELDLVRKALRSGHALVGGGTGLMLFGPPGTGKTAFVEWASHALQVPVFRLNMGELFGSLLGESQNRLRRFIEMVNAAGPAIVHLDEIEKQIPNLRGAASDGGTGAQMLTALLQWMQEAANRRLPIVFAATANTMALDNLPPELISRFPVRFITDFPDTETLAKIFAAHLARYGAQMEDTFALAVYLQQAMKKVTGGNGRSNPRPPVGRDVAQIVVRAAQIALMQRDDPTPMEEDVRQAIRDLREGMIPVGNPELGVFAVPVTPRHGSSRRTIHQADPFGGMGAFLTQGGEE